MFYVLHRIVNPILAAHGIAPVDARIGMDMGQILIARIGVPTGTASHERSNLTAVGPAANLACKLQGMAGTNEIWCGDFIRNLAPRESLHLFSDVTPVDWGWTYGGNEGAVYRCWNYHGVAPDPLIR
jgi:class 3 adenylate cyclase